MAIPRVGAQIEVRQRFTEAWSRGFEVAEVDFSGAEPEVRVRRTSDGRLIPAGFGLGEVRPR